LQKQQEPRRFRNLTSKLKEKQGGFSSNDPPKQTGSSALSLWGNYWGLKGKKVGPNATLIRGKIYHRARLHKAGRKTDRLYVMPPIRGQKKARRSKKNATKASQQKSLLEQSTQNGEHESKGTLPVRRIGKDWKQEHAKEEWGRGKEKPKKKKARKPTMASEKNSTRGVLKTGKPPRKSRDQTPLSVSKKAGPWKAWIERNSGGWLRKNPS